MLAWLAGLFVLGTALLWIHPGSAARPAAVQTVSGAVPSATGEGTDPLLAEEETMDAALESALEAIAGAGSVTVRVHLTSGPMTEYAEKVQQSGSSTSSTEPATGSGGAPLIRGTSAALVDGVLVVASGATDQAVAAEITQAVAAATGAPLYAIEVVPAGEGETR